MLEGSTGVGERIEMTTDLKECGDELARGPSIEAAPRGNGGHRSWCWRRKEVKVGTGMTASIHNKLVTLLRDYQDVFAWSYRDMPGLDSDIVQHRLPLNPRCSR